MTRSPLHVIATAVLLLVLAPAAGAQGSDCTAPVPVCDARAAVFAISSFDPLGSAVRIGPDLLVTNRHVVADNPGAEVFLPDGTRLPGRVLPSSYPGDLILLRVEGLGDGPTLAPAGLDRDGELYTIGADVARGTIRTYAPGLALLEVANGKPLARLHHTAVSQPGNSGGALVDNAGRLVAVTASGGEGRYEAIPAGEIARLKDMTGPAHIEASRRIGAAVAECTEQLDALRGRPRALDATRAERLSGICRASGNRQLLDLAAQALGRAGLFAESRALFEAALEEDPHAINSRLGLVITLHLARRYADELPHLEWLMALLPDDPQVLRFAIQAGKWGGKPDLAERAFALLEEHHPKMAPRARAFLESDLPAPAPAGQ